MSFGEGGETKTVFFNRDINWHKLKSQHLTYNHKHINSYITCNNNDTANQSQQQTSLIELDEGLLRYSDDLKKHTIGFKCSSNVACRYLWRCAIEQMLFFTLPNSQNAAVVSGGGFFSWGTKFKYTGRTEREILTESINAIRDQKLAITSANSRKASSVPTTPSSPTGDIDQIRFSSLPRSTMSEPLNNYITGIRDDFNNMGYCMFGKNERKPVNLYDSDTNVKEENLISLANLNNRYNPDIFGVNEAGTTLPSGSNDIQAYASSYSCESQIVKKNCANILNANTNVLKKKTSRDNCCKCPKPKIEVYNTENISFNRNIPNKIKGVRKFRFINAFVPSFIFVVLAMLVTAIVILESDLDILKQFRNLPEMISLKFQYYQPLKDYILRQTGCDT